MYHSTLDLRVIKKKINTCVFQDTRVAGGGVSEEDTERINQPLYRGTALIRNSEPLGPYSRTMPRAV